MKKLLSVLSVFALAAIAASTASAGPIATPTGLNPGDQFRFVFLSTSTTDATSSDLSKYDKIVSSDASGYTYGGKSPTWQAIVSNSTTDASAHIGLTSTSLTPLYTVDGVQVSSGNLWSGTLLSPINVSITAATYPPSFVWTGTESLGHARTGTSMGDGFYATFGVSSAANVAWVNANTWYSTTTGVFHLYGISEMLTVPAAVPEPSTAMLAGLGGLAALVYSFKRKRN